MWFQSLFSKLGLSLPIHVLCCDNLGAMFLASNLTFHARIKYIELYYHFVQENIVIGSIQTNFIYSQDQIVDVLTKSLSTAYFVFLRSKLIVNCPTIRLRGLLAVAYLVMSLKMPHKMLYSLLLWKIYCIVYCHTK
jgi:hypothetical protein